MICMPITLDQEILEAAEYVYKTRLSKPYTDTAPRKEGGGHDLQCYITIDGKQLHRPIHGLAHTMRTLMYSHLLFPLLQESAKEEQHSTGIYNPLAYFSPEDLKKINIAQLFFVAGRESEASYSEPYLRYHKAGADQFAHYARKHLTHLYTEEEIVLYARCIEDREGDSYSWCPQAHIIHLCHMIDLMRCKGPVEVFLGHSEGVSGIVPTLINDFGHSNAMDILKFTRELFAATGEGVPYIDSSEWGSLGAKPGKVERALKIVGPIKMDGQEADAKKTAQAGFSVEGCYAALQEVEAPEWCNQQKHVEYDFVSLNLDLLEPASASIEPEEQREPTVQPKGMSCFNHLFRLFFNPYLRGDEEEPSASPNHSRNAK